MLGGAWQAMPALLYMVSNLAAFETSTKTAFGPSSRTVRASHLSEIACISKISRTFETSSLRVEVCHFSMMYV